MFDLYVNSVFSLYSALLHSLLRPSLLYKEGGSKVHFDCLWILIAEYDGSRGLDMGLVPIFPFFFHFMKKWNSYVILSLEPITKLRLEEEWKNWITLRGVFSLCDVHFSNFFFPPSPLFFGWGMKKTKECLGSRNLFRADVENSLRIEDDIKCLSILFLPILGVEAGGRRKSSWALSWKEESIRELCVCVLKARNLTINLLLLLAILHTLHRI